MGKEFFVPHASPQSQTERLCRGIVAAGKKIYTFDSASNAHLLQSGFKPISADNFHGIELLSKSAPDGTPKEGEVSNNNR